MRYRFNNFVLDSDRFELTRDGEALRTEPQIIELLTVLVANNGRMVNKDEINEKVWNGRVVSDAALSSRIKSLRHLLGDDGRSQSVIQTVHRKGFRFVPEVQIEAHNSLPAKESDHSEKAASRQKPRIAVMPFANLSADSDQVYFSDGVCTDIIAVLAKHRWLDVVARNSTFGFRDSSLDVATLGQELGADYLVEGSVRRAGKQVRVNVGLADTSSGMQIWSDRYDREIDDIFAVQDDITEKITARLEPEIGFAERNKAVQTRNPDLQAWDCYHLGVYHFYQFTGEGNLEAQRLLKHSQLLDERFGEAYAWWAYAVVLGMVYWDTPPTQELLDAALSACDTALSLDPNNAVFYALRARVLLARREYERAIAENQRAIRLNSSLAAAHCGLGDSLAYEGRYKESIVSFEHAIALSPNDPQLWAFYSYGALAKIFSGDFEGAIAWAEEATLIPNCQYWAYSHIAVANAYLNDIQTAQKALAKVKQQVKNFSLEFVREKMFFLKEQEQIACYLEGLKTAGLT